MAIDLITAALRRMPYPAGGVRAALTALCWAANPDGYVYYALPKLAELSGLKIRAFKYSMRRLQDDGYVLKYRDRPGRPSVWRVTLPDNWYGPPGQPTMPPPVPSDPPSEPSEPDPLDAARRRVIAEGDVAYRRQNQRRTRHHE